jgi:hypothetical protein
MVGLVSSQTGDPKKFLHQLGESVGRSLSDIAGSTNHMAQEIYYERLKLMANGPLSPLRVRDTADGKLIPITQVPSQYNPGPLEGRLATEEDRKRLRANADEALAMIAVRRKIDRFAKDFDPIKPNATGFLGMLEQGAYNTASSAPLLAATAIPYLGIPIAASASTALTFDDIRAREKDTSIGLAFARASLTGLLQTSLDKVQLSQLAGRNPVTGGLVRELVRPDSPLIQRIALKAAGNYAEQTGVEITQNSVPLMVDLLAKTLGADMPDFNAEERLAELKAATPQTFVDTLFPWFVGTGVISVKEMKNGERFRRNTAGFEEMGIPKAEARDLATTENADEFDRKFREAFDKLTPEQRSDYIARKNAQTQDDMPSAERNGNEWIIRATDGREIYRTTNEEAAQAAFDLEAARANRSPNRANWNLQNPGKYGGDVENALSFTAVKDENLNSNELDRLEGFRRSAKDNSLRVVRLDSRKESDSGGTRKAAETFLSAFERVTGKTVTFYDTDEPIPATAAAVNPARPDQIWIHARANRQLLALVGHEWGHTLQHSDPALFARLQAHIHSYIDDPDLRSRDLASPEYDTIEKQKVELTNNVLGDAFTDPEFLRHLAIKDPSLFKQLIDSLINWFDQLIGKVQNTEWGTQAFVTDIEKMRKGIAEILHESITNPKSKFRQVDDSELSTRRNEQTKTLSPVLLMSKEREDGVHRLAKPINERYKSEDERRKDPARVLAGVVSAGDDSNAKKRWKYGRELASPSSLVAWAHTNDAVLKSENFDAPEKSVGGGEHIVFDDPLNRRVIKMTKPGLFGAQAEDAGAYLQRLALSNRVLGDDVKFEGIVTLLGEEAPRAVISQSFVEGRDATTEEQQDYLRSKGFVEHEGKFIHPTLGVTVWDTITTGNVIAKPDGTFQAIDLQVEPSTAEDLKAAREKTGIGRETVFSKGGATNGASNAEVTEWAFNTLKDWRKDISVKIHDSADLIPDENLRQTVLNEGGTVEGFYNPADRSIHILADRMNSEADVQRVLRHEGMHWAFANALQKEYRELLAGTRAKIPKERIDELLAKYRNASNATIVEEYLAYEGQNNPKSTVWVTFAYEAKRLLRKVFGDRVEFTDKDILAFLSKANRRLIDQKAEERTGTAGTLEGNSDGLVSFAKAQPGMMLSQVGNDFVVDDVEPKKLPIPREMNDMVRMAAMEFQSWPEEILSADGSAIRMKVPEKGSLATRARHLISDSDSGALDPDKLAWLPNVQSTITNAAVRLIDPTSNNRIYVRAYRGGTKHMVVVRANGTVESQKPFEGHLITQFPTGSKRQQSMIIDWSRPEGRK